MQRQRGAGQPLNQRQQQPPPVSPATAYPPSPWSSTSTTNLIPQSARPRKFPANDRHGDESAGLLGRAAPPGRTFSGSSKTSFSSSYVPPSDSGHSFVPAMSGPGGVLVPSPYTPSTDNFREPDDDMHEPDPPGYKSRRGCSARGCANFMTLLLITSGILALFAGYPIATFFQSSAFLTLIGENPMVNGTGQVAILANMPSLVDPQTPEAAKTRTGYDGQQYKLVFSDEFNTDNRTFYPGDDPFWEAVDIWYGATEDLEWYDPSQVTTRDGALRIRIERIDNPDDNHNLTLKSGMLQSWNKFCFSGGGYIEISAQLPGAPTMIGYWPGAWLMGNLGRPGYGASTDGLWPYTYDSCDIGTLPNQTELDKSGPPAAFNLPLPYGREKYNFDLSWLPGQRLSACTCQNEDHPGPIINDANGPRYRGRGSPEIDIIEAEKCKHRGADAPGCVSQSAQFAPFSNQYVFPTTEPAIKFWQTDNLTHLNDYRGSSLQQAISGMTDVPDAAYNGPGGGSTYTTFAFEYYADPNDDSQSSITWVSAGKPTLTMTGAAVGPDADTQIGPRIISHEPMAIVLNLAVSKSFQQDLVVDEMIFPTEFIIDYVRVYQRTSFPPTMVGCDPPGYPTTAYIAKHMNAYTNPNLTSWAGAGYTFPKSSKIQGCT